MAKKTSNLDWLTIGQAAKYLGVSKDTLRRWGKHGKIKSYRTPGGRRRYTMYDLELAMKPQRTASFITHQMPKQKPLPKPSSEPILERSEQTGVQTRTFAEGESKEQSDATPETAPKTTQPTKRFSTLTTLVLITILTLLVLFIASGVGRVLLPYLKSSKELLNPTPETYSP